MQSIVIVLLVYILCKKEHPFGCSFLGWVQGLEPWISRSTIWRANQLRHTHHICVAGFRGVPTSLKGFEPPTHGLEGRCSILLSYRLKSR